VGFDHKVFAESMRPVAMVNYRRFAGGAQQGTQPLRHHQENHPHRPAPKLCRTPDGRERSLQKPAALLYDELRYGTQMTRIAYDFYD
jgi:hypothetical protein